MTTMEYLQRRVADLEAELESYRERQRQQELNLQLFDDMDFNAFSTQDWTYFRTTHGRNVRVVMPDGSVVTGLEPHTADMEQMFTYLPDLRITDHSLKVAQGDWTAVVGRLSGTFSRPMKTADGSEVAPTGRRVDLAMATFARWENDQIAEELLFWDTGELVRQLGLGSD